MNRNIKKICITACFTAVISALSQIAIPTPVGVSVTLQTFAIAITAFLLDIKLSVLSVICYCLLGAAGAPVFAGFAGGLTVLLGPSGGFIFAFPVFALFLSLTVYVNKPVCKVIFGAVAIILLYIAGILQFKIFTGNSYAVAITLFIPYFIKDVAVIVPTYFLCRRIRGRFGRLTQSK